jgi:hypothetical protein
MKRAYLVAWLIAATFVPRTAHAWPAEPRFGETPPESPFSTGLCQVSPVAGGADRVWRIAWLPQGAATVSQPRSVARLDLGSGTLAIPQEPGQPVSRRPVAVEYSAGYETRLKIHKYASIATVPLFVAETWLGQSLYNDPAQSESKRGAHGAVAATIGVLFGVNSVTGVWNLVEARKNPAGRTRRTVHGVLMLLADAGFVATGALAPDDDYGEEGRPPGSIDNSGRRSTHRTVALTSMGVALASYVMMLVWRD